jgi:hypothetical protein
MVLDKTNEEVAGASREQELPRSAPPWVASRGANNVSEPSVTIRSKRLLSPPLRPSAPKRLHTTERASLRGITSGTRRAGQLTTAGSCWVFVDGTNWDVLLSLLSHASLDLLRVFVKHEDPELLSLVTRLVGNPGIPVCYWDPDEAAEFSPCHLSLVSYRIGAPFFEAMTNLGVSAVLTTGGFRRVARPWRRSIVRDLAHAALGGITTTTKGLHLAHRVSDWSADDLLPISPAIPRDLGTLLSYGADFSSSSKAPASPQVEPLRAHEVGTGIYHGRGLLPSFPTPSTRIITPGRGLPPNHWGVRALTRTELLQAYDIGDRFHSLIPDSYSLEKTTPLSMVQEAIRQLGPLIELIRGGLFKLFCWFSTVRY